MATRAFIGIENEDSTVTGVYCHFDGYLEGVGRTLQENYADLATVRKLVALGDLSSLGPTLEPEDTVAYARDRGEPDTAARTFASRRARGQDMQGYEYMYVFTPAGWLYRTTTEDWKPIDLP